MNAFKMDVSPEAISFKIEEAKDSKEVDGKHVLAKVSGTFFVPNGVSRNNRFYSNSLWEKALGSKDVIKKLDERRMFGTISHEQPLNDAALLDGKISHIVSNLEIRGDQGFGEALILDTPAGRALNTVLRAGSKLFVSSRANGTFRGEERGVPKVDPDSYVLESFDFVMDPGFLQANPSLVESIQKDLEFVFEKSAETTVEQPVDNNNKSKPNQTNEGVIEMENLQKLLESVTKEKVGIQTDLDSAVKEVSTLKNENAVLTDENSHLKEQMSDYEDGKKALAKYEELGSPQEVEEAFEVAESGLAEYKELGNAADIKEKLERLASIDEKFGTEDRHLAENFEQLEEALTKSTDVVEAYQPLGTPKEIEEAFDKIEINHSTLQEENDKVKIAALATELKVSEDKVKKLWDKGLSEDEIKDTFSDVVTVAENKKKNFKEQYKKRSINEQINNGNKTPGTSGKSKGDALQEKLFRGSTGKKLIEHYKG